MLVSAMIRTTTPIAILATIADPQEDDERLSDGLNCFFTLHNLSKK